MEPKTTLGISGFARKGERKAQGYLGAASAAILRSSRRISELDPAIETGGLPSRSGVVDAIDDIKGLASRFSFERDCVGGDNARGVLRTFVGISPILIFRERSHNSLSLTLRFGVLLHHSRLLSGLPFAGSLCSGYRHLERQLFTSRVHLQRVPLLDVSPQELIGQRILQVFLHGTTHRSSAIGCIVSLIDK